MLELLKDMASFSYHIFKEAVVVDDVYQVFFFFPFGYFVVDV